MSGRNRWLDDDDSIAPTTKGTDRWGDDTVEDFDPNRDYLTQVVERKQDNMLESTYRSLRMLDESERVGAATGEVSCVISLQKLAIIAEARLVKLCFYVYIVKQTFS